MYIDNVRESISELEDDEYKEYLTRLRLVLRKKYKKNVKPSELKQRVDEFVGGKDPKIDYFESYIITFDELELDGGIQALRNRKIKMPKSWRQLLLKVTEDRTLSSEVIQHLEDEEILRELKALFYYSIEFCKDESRDVFHQNLYHFNGFLKITKRRK
ncbi:hypothetical protein [Cytobacillus firmus]|uniref:hypothetical protein n=1 Tax=Cytobacillus firmus TaxID=1399 RepID=UPI0018CED4BD|nr:hypothetical protein [Cytobacillus firmus]MBG9656277.1 hypothetical protein [Cytobacillus firmus]MED1904557.1 hypothetical protein [Cytobacillus firmus]